MSDADAHEIHPEELTLLDYVVGDLGPDSSDVVRRHVETCPTCRDRIVDLAMDMDEIDRLPIVAIPHDLLRGAFPNVRGGSGRRRVVPILLLLAAAIGVVALFQLGGMRGSDVGTAQRQVVLQTPSADPVAVVDGLLGGVPHTLVVDRDDERHIVVLVGDADVGVAYARLSEASSTAGRDYVVDIGGTGQLPATAG